MSHPMHSKRSPYLLSALLTLALGSSAAGQSTTIPLDSRAAFVHVNSDNAPNAVPISLAALGVGPGQCLRLREVGAYDPGPGGDTVTLTIGVFSSSSTLLAGSQLHRVPGAIDAGVDVLTATTFFGNQATDIDEDFSIASDDFSEVTVRVPPGAAYLFVCPTDHYFVDNSDPNGDYGVNITVVGCWTDLGQGLAGAGGAPVLTGVGTLLGGEYSSVDLTGALPNSFALLVFGFGEANLSLLGGTLVPTPDLIFTGLPTGPGGALSLPSIWPVGIPGGISLLFQEWVADPSGPFGFTATNGLRATTP